MLADIQKFVLAATLKAQKGRDHTGRRVRRLGDPFEIVQDDGNRLTVRNIMTGKTTRPDRDEWLSRRLTDEP